mgnify:FL=1
MKSIMFKSTLREIKDSFGRWFAIFAIIALGVGFFCGLKVCKSAFLETGNTYLEEHEFFDYQLISTLGLETTDVENISKLPEVEYAEGSFSADVLIFEEGSDSGEAVTKFLTVSEHINTPSLKAGRMPKNGNECLVDPQKFTEDDIGKTIKISSSNNSETIDMLAYDTYTITGIADSPLYLNFERGSSSIGDGSVSCFVMIPRDGFSSEIFTEIYVKLADSAFIFSKEYDEISDAAEKPLTEALETASERRYQSIIDDARKKTDDARSQIEDSREKLTASENKLKDSEEEIKSKEIELNKNQALINDGLKEYNSGVKQYNEQRSYAYSQLEEYYSQGLISEEQYNYQKNALDAKFAQSWSILQSSKAELDKNQALLDDGRNQINSAKAEIAAGRSKLKSGKQELKEGEAKLYDAEKKLEQIEHPDSYVLDRNTNVGYVCFDNDTSIVEGIAKVFPVFFFLVAALVCMTTMSRMIEEQRTQIGVLKALGYSEKQIIGKYLFYSGSSAVLGGVLGFFAGTYIFTWVIWEAYKMMYEFADVIFVFDWTTGLLALLAAIICSVGTTIYSCYHELTRVPAELIRPKAPSSGKRIFLEKVNFIWKRLKFLQKVSIRNVFRYKKRFFMMILGICGCTALLVTGFGVRDSIKNVVSMQYDEIFHVDYEVTFNHSMEKEDCDKFTEENSDYAEDCIFLHTGSVDARLNGLIKSVNLVVSNSGSGIEDFISIHDDKGSIEYPKTGQGVINSNLAENLKLKVGDSLTVYDSEMNPLTVEISGLCDNYVYNYLYINEDTYKPAWGTPEINSTYVKGFRNDDGELIDNPHEAGSAIMNSSNVSAVTVIQDFRNRIDNMMVSLDYVVALITLSAAALAFIVLYNLTNINITERIREIATIKVLGFYPRETSAYVFRENIALTAIAAIVGLPLGKLLHAFAMSKIQIDLLSFDVHISLLSYILAIVGTFVFAIIINIVMRRKIDKISMTESLKSIE